MKASDKKTDSPKSVVPAPDEQTQQVTMFHDGDCPLCNYEVKILQKLDTSKAIRWVDITKDTQALKASGITYQQAMDRIHVQDAEQNIQTGVSGFLIVWEKLPYYRRLVPVIRYVPLLLPILEGFYRVFARYRLTLTGRNSEKGK